MIPTDKGKRYQAEVLTRGQDQSDQPGKRSRAGRQPGRSGMIMTVIFPSMAGATWSSAVG
jgi:hypothetical protein